LMVHPVPIKEKSPCGAPLLKETTTYLYVGVKSSYPKMLGDNRYE
jgi:hypothetical protein